MNILALTRKFSACDYHRVTLPMMFLPLQPDDTSNLCIKEDHTLLREHLRGRDIVFFNRLPGYDQSYLLDNRKLEGFKYKIAFDIDDYWKLYPEHINYSEWNKHGVTDQLLSWIKAADKVFTTNIRLAEAISKEKDYRDVHILPNSLPFGRKQFVPSDQSKNDERIRFIYAGGNSHYRDIKKIEYAFARLAAEQDFRKKGAVILAGYSEKGDSYWTKTWNIVSRCGQAWRKGQVELNKYMTVYDDADVCLAPLEDNVFNTYKSNLKVIEAGCKKMPIICSKVWPYLEDEKMDGKGLILCKNSEEWINAILFFIKNPEKVKEFGDALHAYVIEKYNLLTTVNEERYKILKSMT